MTLARTKPLRSRRPSRGRPSVDKSALGGDPRYEDRDYLDSLRDQRCVLTGLYARPDDAVDPMHIGTLGRNVKSHDFWALPVLHSLHVHAHQKGEATMLRERAPDDVLRAAFRALGLVRYLESKGCEASDLVRAVIGRAR